MTAYVIGQITIKDPIKWQQYRDQVPATLSPWKAELVFRGVKSSVLAGQHRHTDTVVLRFPDQAAVTGWYASRAYQKLIPLREEAADVDLISYDD
jgi:uncharacterized protein (DUF1330 family)